MAVFDSNTIKNLAADIVKNFIVSQTSLTDGVASAAVEQGFNAEQIKRLVEIVNQVAYLKLLQDAADKTFEFDLASYEDVLASVSGIGQDGVEKVASAKRKNPWSCLQEDGLTKEASELDEGSAQLDQQTAINFFHNHYHNSKRELEKVAEAEILLTAEIVEATVTCRKDDSILEKIAYVVEDDLPLYKKASCLLFDEVRLSEGDSLFYEEDLNQARGLVGLLKTAYELRDKKERLRSDMERMDLVKKAAMSNTVPTAGQNAPGAANATPSGPGKKALQSGASLVGKAFSAMDPLMSAAMYEPKKNVWKSLH